MDRRSIIIIINLRIAIISTNSINRKKLSKLIKKLFPCLIAIAIKKLNKNNIISIIKIIIKDKIKC